MTSGREAPILLGRARTWTRCLPSPTGSRCWSTAASSPPARRRRSAPARAVREAYLGETGLSLLRVENPPAASYGASQALFRVDPGPSPRARGRLPQWAATAWARTTTVKGRSARMIPSTGMLTFERAGPAPPSQPRPAARHRIGPCPPRGRRCFRDLTVAENLAGPAPPPARARSLGHWPVSRGSFPRPDRNAAPSAPPRCRAGGTADAGHRAGADHQSAPGG